MKEYSFYLEKALLLVLVVLFIFIPYSKNIVKPFFCAAAVLWLLTNIFRYKWRFYRGLVLPNSLNLPLFIFLGASILSIVFSLNPYHSQSVFFDRYLPYAVFFWMSLSLTSGSRKGMTKESFQVNPVRKSSDGILIPTSAKAGYLTSRQAGYFSNGINLYFLVGAFLLSGIIFGLGGAYDYFHLHPGRIWTVFSREIPFKMFPVYLVCFIPFSLALFLFSKKWVRWVGLISLVSLVFCWVLQGSRDAWAAVLFSVIAVLLFHKKRITLILLLSMFVIFSFFLLPKQMQKRAETIVQPAKWGGRIELWKTAGRIFEDFSVFGAGIGMYDKLVYKYSFPNSCIERYHFLHAHNTYLEIASEMGLTGLLSFLWIFAVFFRNAFRAIRNITGRQKAVLLGLTGSIFAVLIYGLASSIITVGTQSAPLFWSLLGIASGLISKP